MDTIKQTSPLLNERQAAEFLGVNPQTLAVWRSARRYDLPFIKVGNSVRYRMSALEKWLDKRTVKQPTGAQRA